VGAGRSPLANADELLRLPGGWGRERDAAAARWSGEDGGVGSMEGEGEDGDEGEAGVATEHAQPKRGRGGASACRDIYSEEAISRSDAEIGLTSELK